MRTSDCLKTIKPYMFVEINRKRDELIARGHDVISLSVGDPDASTPEYIVEAMKAFVADPSCQHYPSYYGLPEFRVAAAKWMTRRFGLELDPDTELLTLNGSKEGLAHLHNAFVDPGDYVLVPSIAYSVYESGALLRGGKAYRLPMNESNGYLADFESVPAEVLKRAKIMFLSYPNNPTGAVAPPVYFDRAIEFCLEHDILLCHDNAYCDISFDGYRAPALLERPHAKDCAIEFFSLSKPYRMTGWRLGFCCGNEEAVQALAKVKSNIDSGVFNAVQRAGIVALEGPQDCIVDMCCEYQYRRDVMVETMNSIGLECKAPKATFYVWAKVPPAYTSASFCEKALNSAHVVLTPGSGYGPDGEGFVRISLTSPTERIVEAARRLKECM